MNSICRCYNRLDFEQLLQNQLQNFPIQEKNFFHPTSSYKVMGEEASIDQLKIKKICSAIAGPTTSALTKPEWSHKRH
jgi:hypothetical protein